MFEPLFRTVLDCQMIACDVPVVTDGLLVASQTSRTHRVVFLHAALTLSFRFSHDRLSLRLALEITQMRAEHSVGIIE